MSERILLDDATGRPLPNAAVTLDGTRYYTDGAGRVSFPWREDTLVVNVFPYRLDTVEIAPGVRTKLFCRLPEKLARYQGLLLFALRKGYRLLGVFEWWQTRNQLGNNRLAVLRHDVDYDPRTAMALAFIEHLLGVHSSFYFRWVTESTEAIEYVKKEGCEVGLHYETLAFYGETHGITSPEQVTPAVLDTCRVLLRQEIARFESLHGDIHSIASHGAQWNRQLHLSNALLTDGQRMRDFGVDMDASLLEWHPESVGLNEFVADSGGHWAPVSMREALQQGIVHIYSLTHPCWWRPGAWGPFVVIRP